MSRQPDSVFLAPQGANQRINDSLNAAIAAWRHGNLGIGG